MTQGHHEQVKGFEEIRAGSERGFGIVFTIFFVVIGLWPLIDGLGPRWWAIATAGAFGLAAFIKPSLLRPLNRMWFRFGMLLSAIVNPLVLGLLFFTTVTPMGWIMRALGRDPMRRLAKKNGSYWIYRQPPGPPPDTMKRVF